MEYEYLVNLMMRYIYEQIYISGCAANSLSDTEDDAKLRVEIDLPSPEECCERIDNISRKSIHLDY